MKIVDENTLELVEIDKKITSLNKMDTLEEKMEALHNAFNCDPKEFVERYKKYKKAEAEFKELCDPFKKNLIDLHEQYSDIPTSILIDDIKVTYVSPSVRSSIDKKRLSEEEPEIAKMFTKNTNVAATLRIENIM